MRTESKTIDVLSMALQEMIYRRWDVQYPYRFLTALLFEGRTEAEAEEAGLLMVSGDDMILDFWEFANITWGSIMAVARRLQGLLRERFKKPRYHTYHIIDALIEGRAISEALSWGRRCCWDYQATQLLFENLESKHG